MSVLSHPACVCMRACTTFTVAVLGAQSAEMVASAVVLPLRPEMVSRFTHSLSTSMLAAIETVMMFWAHGELEVWVMPAVVHEDDMISSRVPWMFMVDSVLEIWGTEMVTVTPDTEGVALLRIENEKTQVTPIERPALR